MTFPSSGPIDPADLPAPTEWESRPGPWASYYASLLERLENTAPTVTADQKRGIDDFIQRAGEMLGKEQSDLSPYWRWVVTIYGPEILEHFGTFRFLIPELVPLDLIRQRRVGDTE